MGVSREAIRNLTLTERAARAAAEFRPLEKPCVDCGEPGMLGFGQFKDVAGLWLCAPCYRDRLASREPMPDGAPQ